MEYTQSPGEYLNIRDAAVRYEVSRSKLHRLVRSGRLHVQRDPRDGRASLLSSAELEALFSLPAETSMDTDTNVYKAMDDAGGKGCLTAGARARIDALRFRATGGRRLAIDSADIVREARETRTREAAGGPGKRRD